MPNFGNDTAIQSRRRPIGKGCVQKPGRRANMIIVTCGFDSEMLAAIRAKALTDDTTLSEAIRTLVEWGLEAEATP